MLKDKNSEISGSKESWNVICCSFDKETNMNYLHIGLYTNIFSCESFPKFNLLLIW
jgi:hypothetical protein